MKHPALTGFLGSSSLGSSLWAAAGGNLSLQPILVHCPCPHGVFFKVREELRLSSLFHKKLTKNTINLQWNHTCIYKENCISRGEIHGSSFLLLFRRENGYSEKNNHKFGPLLKISPKKSMPFRDTLPQRSWTDPMLNLTTKVLQKS